MSRAFVALLVATWLVFPAAAESASLFMDRIHERFSTLGASGDLNERRSACREIVATAVDIAGMTQATLARNWNVVSAGMRATAVGAVTRRVVSGCIDLMNKADTGEFIVERVRERPAEALLTVQLEREDGSHSLFVWKLRRLDSSWTIIDISRDGRSLVLNMQAEFENALAANQGDLRKAFAAISGSR